MLRIKPKPYTDNQIEYYSYINYNFSNGYLIEEDNILNSIDASLPTEKELAEQRKRYNSKFKEVERKSKEFERKMTKQHARSILTPQFICENELSVWEDQYDIYVCDKDGSWVKWDRDTYEHFKTKKGFKFKHVSKF